MTWLDKLRGRPDRAPQPAEGPAAAEYAEHAEGEPTWHPDPAQVAVMVKMRRRELLNISRRLGRLDNRPRSRFYEAAATLFAGAVLGGGFGLIPFLDQKPNPGTVDRLIYFGLMVLAGVVAYLCWRASRDTDAERSDTVDAIKDDLDQLMEGSLHE